MLVCLVYLFTPVVTRARWRRLVNTIAGGGVCVWCREVSGSDEGTLAPAGEYDCCWWYVCGAGRCREVTRARWRRLVNTVAGGGVCVVQGGVGQ